MSGNREDVPVGFAMSLGMHPDAMEQFGSMTQEKKERVVSKSRQVRSRGEMETLVCEVSEGKWS